MNPTWIRNLALLLILVLLTLAGIKHYRQQSRAQSQADCIENPYTVGPVTNDAIAACNGTRAIGGKP